MMLLGLRSRWMTCWRCRSCSASAIFTPISTTSADRKSTRLNSSHITTSYAVFCLKKKTRIIEEARQAWLYEYSPARAPYTRAPDSQPLESALHLIQLGLQILLVRVNVLQLVHRQA